MSAAHVWRAVPSEAEQVAALLVAFRNHLGFDSPSDDVFLAGVEQLIEEPATDYLLGAPRPGTQAAGVVQLRYRFSVWRAGLDCLLEDLFVAREARGGGLGRALLHAAIARARERDCRRIELDTAESNVPALALYTSAGLRNEAYEGGRSLFLRMRVDP